MNFNDPELLRRLGEPGPPLDKNTPNAWRHRHGVPDPQLSRLREIALELADAEELSDRGVVSALREFVAKFTTEGESKRGPTRGRPRAARPPERPGAKRSGAGGSR